MNIDIFPWDDNFSVGLAEIDEQHQKLVGLLNQLASHVAFRSDSSQLGKILDELTDYTRYHFETEERIWEKHLAGDELFLGHQKTHASFVDTVVRLRAEQLHRPLEQIAEEALGFLTRWLASHILETDRYMGYLVQEIMGGSGLATARDRADKRMSGATRVLIDLILSIYDSLSSNTLRLMREIAERKRQEIELIQAKLQAETANVTKAEFLRNMSHEFRTPLNGILGMAQVLLEDGVSEVDRKAYANIILEAGTDLMALYEELISLSKSEEGTLTLESIAFEPRALMHETQEKFKLATTSKRLLIETSVEDWVATRYAADAHRIRQMLGNLMSNAIKFTNAGRIRISVKEVERHGLEATLEFSVSDTGIGMEPHQIPLLFQPFSQLDASISRRYGGSGLGLAVVRSLAEHMGGSVGVESRPQQGSRFWFQVRATVAA
jgi:hemerythrin-like metal-binding protein